MTIIGTGSVFGEEVLAGLPIGYRLMVRVEAATFGENYASQRFSRSARHQSGAYRCVSPAKPVSSIVIQDYFASRPDEL